MARAARERLLLQAAAAACLITVWLCQNVADAASVEGGLVMLGDSSAWLRRSGQQFSRRFVLEDMMPVPARGTCRLQWYAQQPPAFGSSSGQPPQHCSGSADSCLEACSSGYEAVQGSGICLQRCPDAAAGPAHLCPVSRTCVRGDSVCPMLADVPFVCTAPDQFLGSCAKQSYQAVIAPKGVNVTCENGLVLQDHAGGWRCVSAPDSSPCSAGFSSVDELEGGIGARCKQVCPSWLVDCGDSCNMPGVACSTSTEQLCPVVPLTACDIAQRTSTALQSACAAVGIKGTAGCPLALTMHGSCGGAKLQVAVGLRTQGFVKSIEGWWGPTATSRGWQSSADGPLTALRVTFTGDKDPVVFGNASHTYAVSPRASFSLDPSELVVSSKLWTSTTVMEGRRLTPVLAGFNMFTTMRNLRVVGAEASAGGDAAAAAAAATAKQQWQQSVPVAGADLGVGLAVGAAAYSSESGVHAFGLLYLSKVAKQEEL